MFKSSIIILAFFLTGCCTTKYDIITRTADDKLKQLPIKPAMINTENADQIDLAVWIAKREKYIADLIASRQTLIDFYEKPISEEERNAAKAKFDLIQLCKK